MRELVVASLLSVGCLSAQQAIFTETFDYPSANGVITTNNNNVPNPYWQTRNATTYGYCNGMWLTSSSSSPAACPGGSISINTDQSGTGHFLFFVTHAPLSGTSIAGDPGGSGVFYLSPAIPAPMNTILTLSWWTAEVDPCPPPASVGAGGLCTNGFYIAEIQPFIKTAACLTPPVYTVLTSNPATTCSTVAAGSSQTLAPPTGNTATWVQSSFSFNSGTTPCSTCPANYTEVVIALVDNQIHDGGNDFGLDTITLSVGYIEVCKASSTTNPVQPSGIYSYVVTGVTGSSLGSSANPITVAVGYCSGPISVPISLQGSTTMGTTTITELPTPGVAVDTITTMGYSPPPLSQQQGNSLLVQPNDPQTGIATVIVYPSAAGDTSAETIVTYTNYVAPNGQLKLCKIAGTTNIAGVSFNFTLPPSTTPISVEAGPAAEGGYCVVLPGTFQVGTTVPIAEMLPNSNYSILAITVNGAPATTTTSAGCAATANCILGAIGPGVNEVSFTNCLASPTQPCDPPSGGGGDFGSLSIVSYSLVSQGASTGTRLYMTYRADLLNTGTPISSPLIARATSLDLSVQVVGQGELSFPSAPANSQVVSSNTFTILADPTLPLDFSKLSWAYYSRRSVPPRR